MYKDTKTWNPFKGCLFDCSYCEKSFKQQAKRQKQNCIKCYNYEPHFHPERLDKIPKAELVFACGNGDIAFAKPNWIGQILKAMDAKKDRTFLLQTKKPSCLHKFKIPDNCIVGTTIETNRATKKISKAPDTTIRYLSLKYVAHPRLFVTFEPILDFDMNILIDWVKDLKPEIVWIGYANHSNGLNLDEPNLEKTLLFVERIKNFTDVKLKTMREKDC